jgi:ribonuclease P protein component
MIINNSFGKTERLSSAKVIEKLFENGRKFSNYPFRIFWKVNDRTEGTEIKVLVSVPKKFFAKAVERNLIKRRVREAYRKNKQILYSGLKTNSPKSIDLAFIYIGKDIIEYHELEIKIISALQNITEHI